MNNTELPNRRSSRLKDYDYAQEGAYFVTICSHRMACTFGEIDTTGRMHLNDWGVILVEEWLRTMHQRAYLDLDAFVVMPNHFHGIVVIAESISPAMQGETVGATRASPVPKANDIARPNGPKSGSLGAIIGSFKSAVSKRIRQLPNALDTPIWHRNYHDVIVRDERMLNTLRAYIENNPAKWAEDRYFQTG
ncbi:MAG: transposase [bacterium]|nr:transposase [bacterium]